MVGLPPHQIDQPHGADKTDGAEDADGWKRFDGVQALTLQGVVGYRVTQRQGGHVESDSKRVEREEGAKLRFATMRHAVEASAQPK